MNQYHELKIWYYLVLMPSKKGPFYFLCYAFNDAEFESEIHFACSSLVFEQEGKLGKIRFGYVIPCTISCSIIFPIQHKTQYVIIF